MYRAAATPNLPEVHASDLGGVVKHMMLLRCIGQRRPTVMSNNTRSRRSRIAYQSLCNRRPLLFDSGARSE